MKKILVFQFPEAVKIKMALATMKIKVESVTEEKFSMTVREILAQQPIKEEQPGKTVSGSLLLMCGLSERELDEVLKRLRNQKIQVTYKAVLTPVNEGWDIYSLYEEMEKERQGILDAKRKTDSIS